MSILCTGRVLEIREVYGSHIKVRNWLCTARWTGWKGIDISMGKFLIALCGATPANIINIQSPISQNLTYIFEWTCSMFHSIMKHIYAEKICNLYKTALNDLSECVRHMNIKSFDHFFVHIDFLVKKIILSVHLISLSRSSDRSNKKFMILMIVANIRLVSVDWTQLVIHLGWGSGQKERTKQNSYTDAWTAPFKINSANILWCHHWILLGCRRR